MSTLTQPPPTLPGFEPVALANVHELPGMPPPPRRKPSARPTEAQPPQDDTTTSLVEAVEKVFRVVRAQIAYHEAQAQRLRKAMEPFASIPAAPEPAVGTGDALADLLALAKRLPGIADTTLGD